MSLGQTALVVVVMSCVAPLVTGCDPKEQAEKERDKQAERRNREAAKFDEATEPPQQFAVQVGGRSVLVAEGETAQVEGTFTNPKVTVIPQPYRVFRHQGISFNYPRSFTFEADLEDSDAKSWTLQGNDFRIMYFVLNTPLSTGDFAENMIEQFGSQNCKVVDANAKVSLGNATLLGTTLQITVAKNKLTQEFYSLPSRGDSTKLIVFQDSLDDAGNRTAEGKSTLEELKSSFTIQQR